MNKKCLIFAPNNYCLVLWCAVIWLQRYEFENCTILTFVLHIDYSNYLYNCLCIFSVITSCVGNISFLFNTISDTFRINQQNENVSSLALKFLLRKTINPTKETVYQLLEEFKQLSMPCALNENYLGPTSLPLYFYVGHQLLEEMGLIQECGPVKKHT